MNRICVLLWLCLVSAAPAAIITVSNTADSGAGSLRDALKNASAGDTIVFTNTLTGQTIYLTSGELVISINLTIDASALPGGVIIDAGKNSRVLEIFPLKKVTLISLTFTNGLAPNNGGGVSGNGGGILEDSGATLTANNCVISGNSVTYFQYGGGIYAGYSSTLTLNNCTISGNSAPASDGGGVCNDGNSSILNNCTISGNSAPYGNGGGIFNFWILALNNCTLFGNSCDRDGGGIYNQDALTLNNCTLSGNSAFAGGGIYLISGTPTGLTNTIVVGNAATYYADICGDFSGADNLTNGDPQLAPLGNYGGPTQTMPPLPGSPAIDAGTDSVTNFMSTDQRGLPRLSGAHVDLGAVEVQFVAVNTNSPLVLTNSVWSSVGGSNVFQFAFTNVSGADFTALTSTNVALPLADWTVLGNIPETSPGQYQFTDPGATKSPQRFYRVVSP